MTWLAVCLLALAAFAMHAVWLKTPRSGWTTLGAALLLGLAGYGAKARPGPPGAPRAVVQQEAVDPAASIAARGLLDESDIPP